VIDMSKRRKSGEIVRRSPGSGFCGSEEPQLVKVPRGKAYEPNCIKGPSGEWQLNEGGEAVPCMMGCGDEGCREWANLEIVNGPHKGEFMSHISECEMSDAQGRRSPSL